MNVNHRINYDILNAEQKKFTIDIFVNGWHVKSATHKNTENNQRIEFLYDYNISKNTVNILKLVLSGEEQKDKCLILKNVIINNSILDINNGYYLPNKNKFWQTLTPEEKKHMKKKVISHGGNLGWFGSLDFEYYIEKPGQPVKDKTILFPVPRIKI